MKERYKRARIKVLHSIYYFVTNYCIIVPLLLSISNLERLYLSRRTFIAQRFSCYMNPQYCLSSEKSSVLKKMGEVPSYIVTKLFKQP